MPIGTSDGQQYESEFHLHIDDPVVPKTQIRGNGVPLPISDPRKALPDEISKPTIEPFMLPDSNPGAPSSEDAKFALNNDFAYGTNFESFAKGKVTIATPPIRGKLGPEMDNLIANLKVQNVPEPLQNAVGEAYTKTALMAKKSAIASLGFDPARIAVEWGNRDTNVAGFYSRKPDVVYANQNYYDVMLHESIHRGFEELRKSGNLTDEENQFLKGNMDELATRHITQLHANTPVPPEDSKEAGHELERQAQYYFKKDSNFPWKGAKNREILESIEKKAADLLAKRRPGGPR